MAFTLEVWGRQFWHQDLVALGRTEHPSGPRGWTEGGGEGRGGRTWAPGGLEMERGFEGGTEG